MIENTSICFLNGTFPPYIQGGAENYIINIAKELKRLGGDIYVVTTKKLENVSDLSFEQTNVDELTVYRFAPPNVASRSTFPRKSSVQKGIWRIIDAANLYSYKSVRKILTQIEPDIVHSNNLMGISTLSMKAVQKSPAAHVHTLHDYSLLCPSGSPRSGVDHPAVRNFSNSELVINSFSKFQKVLSASPDFVTAPSNHIIDTHRKHNMFNEVPTKRIKLGVESRTQCYNKSPINNQCLYVGRITKRKGLDTLIKAAEIDSDVVFHICGTGPYEKIVQKRAAGMNNVKYHGYVDEDKLENLRSSVDIAVVPSLWMENSPLTIYESFARGLPVVGSNIGGIPELIEHGKTGGLFEPGDEFSLSSTINWVLDSERIHDMSENALSWSENHTLSSHIDRVINLYNNIM